MAELAGQSRRTAEAGRGDDTKGGFKGNLPEQSSARPVFVGETGTLPSACTLIQALSALRPSARLSSAASILGLKGVGDATLPTQRARRDRAGLVRCLPQTALAPSRLREVSVEVPQQQRLQAAGSASQLPSLRLGCELAVSEMLWGQKAAPWRAVRGETPRH